MEKRTLNSIHGKATDSAKPPIQFYFDFISPFGYFASLRIDTLAANYGRTVEWTSMLLGVSVVKVMKSPPILSLPLKGAYLIKDANRYARLHKVPYESDDSPRVPNPLEAGRLFAWAKESSPEKYKSLAKAIFRANFVERSNIGDMDVLRACAIQTGVDWAAYEQAAEGLIPAALLRRNVDNSIAQGVFGSPFFIVDGEPFFGVEKMENLEQWLAADGW